MNAHSTIAAEKEILIHNKRLKAKAIEHYEKFLDLWKDADPSIAAVEDAKKRVARVKSQIPKALAFLY